jgi:hypothetical protein
MYDYPTEDELQTITDWNFEDGWNELMTYIKSLWKYADWGYSEETKDNLIRYRISTCGWSGNEEIISAMKENYMFWNMCWAQSRRGGHYIFEIQKGT